MSCAAQALPSARGKRNSTSPGVFEHEKQAAIDMVAAFENGRARVRINLRYDGGTMKLWHMDVDPNGPVKRREKT